MARSRNFSAGIPTVYACARVRYIVLMVGLEPRKQADKFKIRYNMSRDDRGGYCQTSWFLPPQLYGFFSYKM